MNRWRHLSADVRGAVRSLALAVGLAILPATAGALELVSVGPGGVQGNGDSGAPVTNLDGRFVVFTSRATNLVAPLVTPFQTYLRDRMTGETVLVSAGFDGTAANSGGFAGFVRSSLGLSADGRYLAYDSQSTNLVLSPALLPAASNNVYLWDQTTGITTLVSVGFGGVSPNDRSGVGGTAISADGSTVAFQSDATNLVGPATDPGSGQLYVYTVAHGPAPATLRRIPVPGDAPSLNGDGTLLAYRGPDVVVRNLLTDEETLANVDPSGVLVPGGGGPQHGPKISGDGRSVAFVSAAGGLVVTPAVTPGRTHVYVRHLDTLTTELVDVAPDGTEGNGELGFGPVSISDDGRHVAFATIATNLLDPAAAPPPSPSFLAITQVFVRDLTAGTTRLVSTGQNGVPGNASSDWPSISGDGARVAFQSDAKNLVFGDANGERDVFIDNGTVLYNDPTAFAVDAGPLALVNFDRACGSAISPPASGVEAGSLYDRLGVTFTGGRIFAYPGAAPVVVSSPNEISSGPVAGTFASPVHAVGITNTGAVAILRVFDAADNLLASLVTDPFDAEADFVGIVSLRPIVRFEYVFVSGLGFGGDDLVFSQIRPPDCVPPVLSLPTSLLVDAISPAGAIVKYAVTAKDDTDKTPFVFCKPAPGSLFPIGATMVACTAKDATGNTADGSFSVIVRGADAQTKSLIEVVQGLQIQQVAEDVLLATLQLTLRAEARGADRLACAELLGFRLEVAADAKLNLLSAPQAATLQHAATQIRAVLGCP